MMIGPTQFTPMYCAPRGSWCAHISSRTTVCSHTEESAAAELLGPGHAQQVAFGQHPAELLGRLQVRRVIRECAQIVFGHLIFDQVA